MRSSETMVRRSQAKSICLVLEYTTSAKRGDYARGSPPAFREQATTLAQKTSGHFQLPHNIHLGQPINLQASMDADTSCAPSSGLTDSLPLLVLTPPYRTTKNRILYIANTALHLVAFLRNVLKSNIYATKPIYLWV